MKTNTQTQTSYSFLELKEMTIEWLTRNGWEATTNRGDIAFKKEGHAEICVSQVSTTYYNTYLEVKLDMKVKTRIKDGSTPKNYASFQSRVHALIEKAWTRGQRAIEVDKRKAVVRKAVMGKFIEVRDAVEVYNSLNTHQLEVYRPALDDINLDEYDGGTIPNVFYTHNYNSLERIIILGWSSEARLTEVRRWRDKNNESRSAYQARADLGAMAIDIKGTVKRCGNARFEAGEGYKQQIAEHPDSACALEDILSNWDITYNVPNFNQDGNYGSVKSKHQRAFITDGAELIGAIGATLKTWKVILDSSKEGLRAMREIEDNFKTQLEEGNK